MEVTAFIFARGGSKGLPGKNLLKIGGTSLIGHSILLAKSIGRIDRVICSTDSLEIASEAKAYGAEVPFMRPAHLATDTSPELDSWKHAVSFLLEDGHAREEIFISLPATAPLRKKEDVEKVISLTQSSNTDLVLTYSEASHNPWFNMVMENSEGYLNIVNRNGPKSVVRRQDAPEVYNLVPVAYGSTLGYIVDTDDLFAGHVRGTRVSRESAIDIDTSFDFVGASLLFESHPNDL